MSIFRDLGSKGKILLGSRGNYFQGSGEINALFSGIKGAQTPLGGLNKFSKLGDMRDIKLSGLSNNHCIVSFSNTDNSISKCKLSNIAQLMLCFNFLSVYRSQFGSLHN